MNNKDATSEIVTSAEYMTRPIKGPLKVLDDIGVSHHGVKLQTDQGNTYIIQSDVVTGTGIAGDEEVLNPKWRKINNIKVSGTKTLADTLKNGSGLTDIGVVNYATGGTCIGTATKVEKFLQQDFDQKTNATPALSLPALLINPISTTAFVPTSTNGVGAFKNSSTAPLAPSCTAPLATLETANKIQSTLCSAKIGKTVFANVKPKDCGGGTKIDKSQKQKENKAPSLGSALQLLAKDANLLTNKSPDTKVCDILQKTQQEITKSNKYTISKSINDQTFHFDLATASSIVNALETIGKFSKNKTVMKTAALCKATIEGSKLCAAIAGIGPMAALGPVGIACGLLSLAMTVGGIFKNNQDTSMAKMMGTLTTMINDLRQEMHENFEKVISQLQVMEKNIVMQLCDIGHKQDRILEKINLLSHQVQLLQELQLQSTGTIVSKIESVFSNISCARIADEKLKLLQGLKVIMNDNIDRFDINLSKLISTAEVLNETLSGPVNIKTDKEQLLARFGKMSFDFNINSLFQLFVDQNIKVPTIDSVDAWFRDITKDQKYYYFRNVLTHQDLALDFTQYLELYEAKCDPFHLVPIFYHNKWTLLVIDFKNDKGEYYGDTNDYDLIKTVTTNKLNWQLNNMAFGTATQVCFIAKRFMMPKENLVDGPLVNSRSVAPRDEKSAQPIDVSPAQPMDVSLAQPMDVSSIIYNHVKNTINVAVPAIHKIHNPLILSLLLSFIMDHIQSQPMTKGFMSDKQHRALVELASHALNIRSFVSWCHDPQLFNALFTSHITKLTDFKELAQAYQTRFYEQVASRLADKKNDILSKEYYGHDKITLFQNQIISINSLYFSTWWHYDCHHYAGKQMGADNISVPFGHERGASYTVHQKNIYEHDLAAQIVTQKTNTINEIASFRKDKKMSELLSLNVNDGIAASNDFNFTPKTTTKEFPFVMYPTTQNLSTFPILPCPQSLKSAISQDVWIAQEMGLGHICVVYDIHANKFTVSCSFVIDKVIDFVDGAIALGAGARAIPLFTLTEAYCPSFYTGKEAIWWYWVGGNIAAGNGTHQVLDNDTGCNYVGNAWRNYVQIPTRFDNVGCCHLIGGSSLKRFLQDQKMVEKTHRDIKTSLDPCIQREINNINVEFLELLKNSPNMDLSTARDNLEVSMKCLVEFASVIGKEQIIKTARASESDGNDNIWDKTSLVAPSAAIASSASSAPRTAIANAMSRISAGLVKLKETHITFMNKLKTMQYNPIWLDFGGIEQKYIKLLADIEPLVTKTYSASEKLQQTMGMSDILFKVIEIGQQRPEIFKKYNIHQVLSRAKEQLENDQSAGTIKGSYADYVVTSMKLITGSDISGLLH